MFFLRKGFKLIILDEADAMTNDAQNALRRSINNNLKVLLKWECFILFISQVLEKFTENTRFCIICNYLSKIIPAIQSRCTRFRFGPLTEDKMRTRIEYIIQQEKYIFQFNLKQNELN